MTFPDASKHCFTKGFYDSGGNFYLFCPIWKSAGPGFGSIRLLKIPGFLPHFEDPGSGTRNRGGGLQAYGWYLYHTSPMPPPCSYHISTIPLPYIHHILYHIPYPFPYHISTIPLPFLLPSSILASVISSTIPLPYLQHILQHTSTVPLPHLYHISTTPLPSSTTSSTVPLPCLYHTSTISSTIPLQQPLPHYMLGATVVEGNMLQDRPL